MAPRNLSTILLERHLASGELSPGHEIGLIANQALLTDVLGTLVMLELEAMNVDRVRIGVAAQYVDHNLLEVDNVNAEEHLFLQSACQKLGIWYARAGTGISHPVHMERFGKPGELLIGCDSHTCAAGGLGMLAIGMGGIDVALALVGEPFFITVPKIWGVHLSGQLSDWVSAKDVILEMLRRHGVEGGSDCIIEYYGPGLACLSAMDRHVIANMGAEMGATSTIFPSDERTREYLKKMGRPSDWTRFEAEEGATFDRHDEIDLSALEPMIAMPSSPGNVARVRDVPKVDIFQSYIGSSANPGYRDLAVAAAIVEGRTVHERVSLDINPSSRQLLQQLVADGHLTRLINAGGRIHQPGCNGCIGMGQAPAKNRPSLRTVPRNFPGRSGTVEDSVYLCSPETAAASAIMGIITDPRGLGMAYPHIAEPEHSPTGAFNLVAPLDVEEAKKVKIQRTANIMSLPNLSIFDANLNMPILLKVGNDVSTDAIIPAGNEVMPHWTNFAKVRDYAFRNIDATYPARAKDAQTRELNHVIVGGNNYGQGSSRENAALIPRAMGLGMVIAKSFARIHWQNLINFGVIPLTFENKADYEGLNLGTSVVVENFIEQLNLSRVVVGTIQPNGSHIMLGHNFSERQIKLIAEGGAIRSYRANAEIGAGR